MRLLWNESALLVNSEWAFTLMELCFCIRCRKPSSKSSHSSPAPFARLSIRDTSAFTRLESGIFALWWKIVCQSASPTQRRTPLEWQPQIESKAIRAKSAAKSEPNSSLPARSKTGGEISIWANSPLPIFDWTISLMAAGSMDLSTHLPLCSPTRP